MQHTDIPVRKSPAPAALCSSPCNAQKTRSRIKAKHGGLCRWASAVCKLCGIHNKSIACYACNPCISRHASTLVPCPQLLRRDTPMHIDDCVSVKLEGGLMNVHKCCFYGGLNTVLPPMHHWHGWHALLRSVCFAMRTLRHERAPTPPVISPGRWMILRYERCLCLASEYHCV